MGDYLEYAHELSFTNNFDRDIVEYSAIDVKGESDFVSQVEGAVNNILMVLSLQPGVTSMSTFVVYNDVRYKINLVKV